MPKTLEQLQASKAGQTQESNGFGAAERPLRPGGAYELREKDGTLVDRQVLKTHPKFGDSQAAAFERLGYEYVGAAKEGEVKTVEIDALATEGTDAEGLKGVQARLSLIESEGKKKDETIAALRAELGQGAADGDTKANAKEEAKTEAVARTDAREDTSVGTGADETLRTEELKGNVTTSDTTAPDDAELKPSTEDETPKKGSASDQNKSTDKKAGK